MCEPSLSHALDQHGNVVLDRIVYLALRIAHNTKYSYLVLAVSSGREHAGIELLRCQTYRLEKSYLLKKGIVGDMVKETKAAN